MSFVTDEIVRAAAVGARRAHLAHLGYLLGQEELDALAEDLTPADLRNARAALTAASPLWLAHVQAASEHTADYRMAAAAAELRRGTTTEGGSTT